MSKWHIIYCANYECWSKETFDREEDALKFINDFKVDDGSGVCWVLYGQEFELEPYEKVKAYKLKEKTT